MALAESIETGITVDPFAIYFKAGRLKDNTLDVLD